MPAFGTAAIREMFPDMLDLAEQLVLKWERYALGTASLELSVLIDIYILDLGLNIGSILRRTSLV